MYKLVIAEDDYQIRTGLGNFFPWREVGFEVVGCFKNGKLAWDYIDSNGADVVLSDIQMPVMSGLELASQIKEKKKQVEIVFLTVFRSFEYAQQALNLGAKNYIVKSTKYDDLMSVFRKIKIELDHRNGKDDPPERFAYLTSAANSEQDIKKINKIAAYIDCHYRDASLQTVAGEMSMNPVYLSRFFKEKTGINFNDFVTEIKMKKAAELIKRNRYKIYEISEMVGYTNAKNFSRAFKNYYQISPQDFKDQEF